MRYSVEAIILKFNNYKDSDKIYTLYTKEKGKISANAKGVRKISSRRAGNLDTLNHVVVGISESNKGFKVITEAKTLNSFMNLKSSLDNSTRGFYIAELIHKLMEEEQENWQVFDLLVSSLTKLDTHLNNETSRINAFEIKLMDLLGYGLYLDQCSKCERKYDDSWEEVRFNQSFGGFVCDRCSGAGIKIKRRVADLLHSLKSKKGIHKDLLSDKEVVNDANNLIRMYVREVVEGNLKSIETFNGVQN